MSPHVREHVVTVPLDHAEPGGATIDVYAREIVAAERAGDDLPWLLFLQGGPGSRAPRPAKPDGWLGYALRTHRVLLLDQRGTGRSAPITARTVRGMSADALAARLRLFRADSIVADAEILRRRLAEGRPWETLGQSYGGFITLTYLSFAPEGLRACYVTAGLPNPAGTADEVYDRTYPLVAARNAAYYRRHPGDAAAVRAIADVLERTDVRLPDGDRLTARRFRLLGMGLGMSDGFDRLHALVEDAWSGLVLTGELPDEVRYQIMADTGFVDRPIFALQEFTYGQAPVATGWAAERALSRNPAFAPYADPLLFTGEMMYPWMFREITALRPFAGAAERLAAATDWPPLYDLDRLAANRVPVSAAVFQDDMYVPAELQKPAVGALRTWYSDRYLHDGIRMDGARVLARLMEPAREG